MAGVVPVGPAGTVERNIGLLTSGIVGSLSGVTGCAGLGAAFCCWAGRAGVRPGGRIGGKGVGGRAFGFGNSGFVASGLDCSSCAMRGEGTVKIERDAKSIGPNTSASNTCHARAFGKYPIDAILRQALGDLNLSSFFAKWVDGVEPVTDTCFSNPYRFFKRGWLYAAQP